MTYPSHDEEVTIQHQFDRACKLALKRGLIDYQRHNAYLRKHESTFSELSEAQYNQLYSVDNYDAECDYFQVLGYEIFIKDALLAEALQKLTEKKRNVILLSYFLDMSDADIAQEMHVVYQTIHKHRLQAVNLLKQSLKEKADGEI